MRVTVIPAQYAGIRVYKIALRGQQSDIRISGLDPTFNVKWVRPGVIDSNVNAI